ncbi:MAG TPA: tripartite tricarboxylate transporter substrate-binding protein, partial [Burkholderiales bacterium]|nr:tripartite tricarboxylate transporter substrate-binding protein [Burkholderiales bacterium]
MNRWAAALGAAAMCCVYVSVPSNAQQFPTKPVRIIVAFPPGGGTDIVARIVGAKLAEGWGQQAIVDNRAGASGVIGTEAAARAAPDGYTWFMGTMGNLTVNQHLYQK